MSGFNLRKEKHDGNHLKKVKFSEWTGTLGQEDVKNTTTAPHVDSSGLMGTIVWMYGVYYGILAYNPDNDSHMNHSHPESPSQDINP